MAVFLAALTLTSLRHTSAVSSKAHKKPSKSLKKSSNWQTRLQKQIDELEKTYPGQIGLYIKDLNTGEEYALHAEESWYLASTVKIPVAMEVLRQIDMKRYSLNDEIEITPEDYVDGNGPLKFRKPGEKVTIKYLIEQMIIWSDNVATDMLLRIAGLENVNKLVKAISPEGFSDITSLKDVRRHVYGGIHPNAFKLSGQNFIELKSISNPIDRFSKLVNLMDVETNEIKLQDIDGAYESYYEKGLNSASPKNYSRILEELWTGKLLTASSRDFLVKTMLKTETGKKRIRAGLKSPWVFAHKTGTQYKRIADVGYIWNPDKSHRKPVIVVSFVRNISEQRTSAGILEKVAKIISNSGVL